MTNYTFDPATGGFKYTGPGTTNLNLGQYDKTYQQTPETSGGQVPGGQPGGVSTANNDPWAGFNMDADHAMYAPLHDASAYDTYGDADDAAGVSNTLGHYLGGKDKGYIWRGGSDPSGVKMHLNGIASAEDLLNNTYGSASFGPGYRNIVTDKRFDESVAALAKMFDLPEVDYKQGAGNPLLGGRGDERRYDPAELVGNWLGEAANQYKDFGLNPWGVQDPIEYMYQSGLWQRPTDANDYYSKGHAVNQGAASYGGMADPKFSTGYGHFMNTVRDPNSNLIFRGEPGQTLLTDQAKYRTKDYTTGKPSGTYAPPAQPPGGAGGHWWEDGGKRVNGVTG